jgi:oligopeptide/dipeptide ABC transporter ATP-binding protein
MVSVLEIQDLSVSYRSPIGITRLALSGVGFELAPGEILGVLGESGSGKSTLAAALVRLLPRNGDITSGAVFFEGKDLLRANAEELQQIRGGRIALIFQEPSLSLHPTMRAGEQVRRVLAAHGAAGKNVQRERTRQVLSSIFLDDAERVSRSYPQQLSGGQRQRVLIAQAIACQPRVIVADEPTASLDPTTQMEILGVFRAIREKLGLAMIFITHNPALLAGFADRVLILYGGRVVEWGPAEKVLNTPRHPYTKALLQSMPANLEEPANQRRTRMLAIAGDSSPASLPRDGCRFEPRCTERLDICRGRAPELTNVGETHTVACLKYES